MREKVKLLFLCASPEDEDPTCSDVEFRDVDARIQAAINADAFEIAMAPALKRADLQTALLRHRPQIVHFSGHSDSRGILLEGDQRSSALVTGPELAELFAILRGTVRIVVLNSCASTEIARAFQHFVDYTVAMNRRISNEAAITFATAFYNALAMRQPVPKAFALGVSQLRMEKFAEFDAPQLFVGAMLPAEPEPEREPPKTPPKGGGAAPVTIVGSVVRGSVVVVSGDGNVVVTR